jgi:hypothetical protein
MKMREQVAWTVIEPESGSGVCRWCGTVLSDSPVQDDFCSETCLSAWADSVADAEMHE